MTKPIPAPPRRAASGINLVITAASLAATLGGWAALTVNDRAVAQAVVAAPPALVQPANAAPPEFALAPLPTLIPRREFARAAAPAPPAAQPRQAAPVAVRQPAPAALPPPVAQTRSSR